MRCFMMFIIRVAKWIKNLFIPKHPLSCGGNRNISRRWHLRIRLVDCSDIMYQCPMCGSTEIYLIPKQNTSPMVKDVAYVVCGKCFFYVEARSESLACSNWLHNR